MTRTCGTTMLRLLASVMLLLAGNHAWAQADYPSRSIRLIVPFAPGGSADLVARVLASKLTEQFGQTVYVDNKPGANMNIGADMVAKATPDGYTALYNTSNMIFNISIYPTLTYDPLKDFAPVALTAAVPQILVVNPSLPVKNLQEFINYARSRSGKLNYASVGVGAISHLTTALFLNANKLTALHVPYKGSPQAYADLLSGRVDFYFATVASAVPFLKGNKVRAIAVTSLERNKAVPTVPTMHQSGMPNFEATSWQGVLVPAKTPTQVIGKLNGEILRALKNQDLQRQLDAYGTIALGSTPAEYGSYMRSEAERWGKIIRAEGIRQ